jgi:hypothetical protein
MRDYLNSKEKEQFMVLQSVVQLMDGLKNSGVDGPKISSMLEEWKNKNNLTKEEHKNLKTSETYLRKFLASVYERLSSKEQDVIKKRVTKFGFKLIDDFTLQQLNRDMKDKLQYAVMPRQQFYDWCVDIMEVKCNGCTKDWNTCDLYQVFENNFVPESSFDCSNCKFAYRNDNE